MGYDLHITRAADWTQAEDAPITSDEWLSLERDGNVDTSPEMDWRTW